MADLSMIKPDKEAEKRPWCHRLYVPIAYGEQVKVPGLGEQVQMKGNMTFTRCLGNQCALWCEGEKKCGDLVQAEATLFLANAKDREEKSIKIMDGSQS